MKIRSIIASAAILAAGIGTTAAITSNHADAAVTTIQTQTSVETIVSAKCYIKETDTAVFYHYTTKYGWVKYPAPKRTYTGVTTCHK